MYPCKSAQSIQKDNRRIPEDQTPKKELSDVLKRLKYLYHKRTSRDRSFTYTNEAFYPIYASGTVLNFNLLYLRNLGKLIRFGFVATILRQMKYNSISTYFVRHFFSSPSLIFELKFETVAMGSQI